LLRAGAWAPQRNVEMGVSNMAFGLLASFLHLVILQASHALRHFSQE
jgi:hypothetical protein